MKTIGPGLLFASSSIGTSHLILSTRAGAHHGMIFIWIILAALLFKYPFYEFGPRYANATGYSLLKGYKDQGKWAVVLYLAITFVSMFAVTGAVGAVSAGLLSTMFGLGSVSMPYLLGGLLSLTAMMLLIGRYSILDHFIKLISLALLVTVFTAFFAVLFNGPIEPVEGFVSNHNILEGAGLALLVSLVGWMPSGMEASTMNSIWVVEKIKTSKYHPTLKESLFDFNLGYGFTVILALMFLTIGAFTVYGSGQILDGNSTQFSNKLLKVFTTNLGEWSYLFIAIAAFGTIYGTLITAWDAFARSFARGLRVFKFEKVQDTEEQQRFLRINYNLFLPLIGLGGFILFSQFTGSMIKILEVATIFSFLAAPIVAFLNLRAIQGKDIPSSHHPSKGLLILAYLGLLLMIVFSIYYLQNLLANGFSH